MKKCPSCYQLFGDENDFCLNDGTPLVVESGSFRPSGDVPTQFIPRAQPTTSTSGGGSSAILYVVIGVLATALVAVCVYLIFLRDTPKNAEVAAANTNQAASSPAGQASPAGTPINAVVKPAAPAINPNLTPAGNWQGSLSYASGTAFSAAVNLDQSPTGQVTGQIVWSLLRTANPKKMGMAGQSATEFVNGTFDAATKTLTLVGVRKNDPANMIILDKYRLTISDDGRSLSGVSFGGKAKGTFRLQK